MDRSALADAPLRFVDIEDGTTEFRVGCTTTHYPPAGSAAARLGAERGPPSGFRVCATEAEALSVDFPPYSPLVYAPRALLVVMAGGRPTFHDTREVAFYQLTPVAVVAACEGFAKLFDQYFGDAYYHPTHARPPH
jgi:hypothetical protein